MQKWKHENIHEMMVYVRHNKLTFSLNVAAEVCTYSLTVWAIKHNAWHGETINLDCVLAEFR